MVTVNGRPHLYPSQCHTKPLETGHDYTLCLFYSRPSEGNVGVYSSTQSLVINSSGRTVYSNPGSPKSSVNLATTLRGNNTSTSYCDSQLPLPVHTDSTVVIPDDNHSAYCNAFSNSNAHLVMPQMGGAYHLPNEACNSHRERAGASASGSKMLMSPHSFPVDPLQGGSSVYFQENPNSDPLSADFSAPTASSAEPIDLSLLVDSTPAGVLPPREGKASSSMVVGVGAAKDDSLSPVSFLPSNQANVFESEMDTMIRELVTASVNGNPSLDMGIQDFDLLKTFDSNGLDPALVSECLSTPTSGDLISEFGGMSIQPIQAQSQQQQQQGAVTTPTTATPTKPSPGGWEAVQEQQSAIADDFDIIKMMNVQLKPSAPANLGLKASATHMVPVGHIPSPMHSENSISPSTPYTPNPQPITPVEASAPSPSTPHTPKTPSCPSQNGPFQLRSYVEEEKRVCEIGLRGDLPPSQHQFALRALLYSMDIHQKMVECLSKPCDLKVAIDARAELCGAKFDQASSSLQFSMPQECE